MKFPTAVFLFVLICVIRGQNLHDIFLGSAQPTV